MSERVYFPYDEWECFKSGMYETKVKFLDPEQLVNECEQMLRCPNYLWESMMFVTHNWPKAAHQHLSNEARNRQAWLGQAACSWAHGAPEFITKRAWNQLDGKAQEAANKVADEVILDWESKIRSGYWAHAKNIS